MSDESPVAPKPAPPVEPPPWRDAGEGESDETAHYDDAVIGLAFRWSLVALVVLLAGGAAVLYWIKRKPAAAGPPLTQGRRFS